MRILTVSIGLNILLLCTVCVVGCSPPGELTISIRRGNAERPNEPLIVTRDILAYDWRSHEVVLTEDAWARINRQVTYAAVPGEGLPFVVSVNGKAIYEGRFWTMVSSFRPSAPVVYIEGLREKKFLIVPCGQDNLVSSPEIFRVLKRRKILKNAGTG